LWAPTCTLSTPDVDEIRKEESKESPANIPFPSLLVMQSGSQGSEPPAPRPVARACLINGL
jgi:hypothetical protein